MGATFLWVKAFHIIFVASWFAAVFYLPRILVNLAMVEPSSEAERNRLLLMGRKLYRFGFGLMLLALGLGLALWLIYGVGLAQGWMHAKLALVVGVVAYYVVCGQFLKRFQDGTNTRSHRWFRVFNEVAVLAFFAITILVVVKPF
jgi:protoporphyrinogen IX oxidase